MQDDVLLPLDGRAAGQARRLVQQHLMDWDLTSLCDEVVLLTSELVTNVLIHTTSAPRLTIVRTGRGVRVTVADGSPVPPAQRRASREATTGRGVRLMEGLADDWGWQPDGAGGKAVWFEVTGSKGGWDPEQPPGPHP